MQFSTFALAALSIGCTLAQSGQITVHVVTVGNTNGSLTYSPDSITASKGDMVQFQFMPKNHTVTQSNFDNPCEPVSMHSNVTGVFSGFMPVAATDTSIPTYTILINNTNPMWIYCAQGKHCQSGMSMVINENTKANATRSLANYQMMAKSAPQNIYPGMGAATDGTTGTVTASGTSTGNAAGNTASSTTSAGTTKQTTSGATTSFKAPAALSLAGLLAAGVAIFL